MITLYANGSEEYVSFDAFIVMRRCKNIRSPNGNSLEGRWGLFHNGTLCDWDQYRNDLTDQLACMRKYNRILVRRIKRLWSSNDL